MEADSVPKQLREKTEKHYCVKCLREVERDEYFENDFLCDSCAAGEPKAEEKSEQR